LNFKRLACIAALFLFCVGSSLYAQSTAQEMEALLANDELTYAQASRFILRASDKFVTSDDEEAFWFAAKKGWLPKYVEPDEPARIDGIGLLIMNAFDIEGGFFYSVTKSPQYAFRELEHRNIIQGRADRYMKISGEFLVFTVGRVLAQSEKEADRAAKFAEERQAQDKKQERLQPETFDFGLIFSQDNAIFHDFTHDDTNFVHRANAVPRVSFLMGDNAFFITSLGFGIEYVDEELYGIFELLRTEFSIYSGAFGLKAGRFNYSDPTRFVADSLYDGIQLIYNSGIGRFGLGGWYTGALYKRNANILMTQNDRLIYDAPRNKNRYFENYFAPRRAIVSMDWEHPSLSSFLQLKTALTGQFDMSGLSKKYHSQYFTVSTGLNFKDFVITAGGSIEAGETRSDTDAELSLAAAGELGLYFSLPAKYNSQLSLKARYGSGVESKSFNAFIPITTTSYGEIFQVGISGHTMFDLTYSVRFFETLGASLTASYFIRSDLLTPASYIMTGEDMKKKLLGAEFFSKIIWSPFSDMQYTLGVGAFFPHFGNNWPNARAVWKIDLAALIAIY